MPSVGMNGGTGKTLVAKAAVSFVVMVLTPRKTIVYSVFEHLQSA